MSKLAKIDWIQLLLDKMIWVVLLLVFVFFSIQIPAFLTVRNLISVLVHASVLGVLVIGQTIVLLTGNFDLSAEGMLSLTTILAMWLMIAPRTDAGGAQASGLMLSPLIVIPIMLIVGGFGGWFNGFMITRLKMNNFIVTLAMQLVLRGIAMILSGGQIMTGSPRLFNLLGGTRIYGIPISAVVTILMFIIVNYLLKHSKFGRELLAVGANRDAAKASGFNPAKTVTRAYIISGILAGFAGWMLLGRLETSVSTLGQGMTLETVAAAVIGGVSLKGGIGSVGGAFAGVLLLAVIGNALNIMDVNPFAVSAIRGLIILLALLLEAQKFRYKPKVMKDDELAAGESAEA